MSVCLSVAAGVVRDFLPNGPTPENAVGTVHPSPLPIGIYTIGVDGFAQKRRFRDDAISHHVIDLLSSLLSVPYSLLFAAELSEFRNVSCSFRHFWSFPRRFLTDFCRFRPRRRSLRPSLGLSPNFGRFAVRHSLQTRGATSSPSAILIRRSFSGERRVEASFER